MRRELDEPTGPPSYRDVSVLHVDMTFTEVVGLWLKVILGLLVAMAILTPLWVALVFVAWVVLSVVAAAG